MASLTQTVMCDTNQSDEGNSSKNSSFYKKAQDYWSKIPATVDGMLGGFGFISQCDIEGSGKFLQSLIQKLWKREMLSNKSKQGAVEGEVKVPLKPTIRLNIALSEPNKEWCPVFNYQSLLKAALDESDKQTEPTNPEEDEVRKLAKKFEEKYGKENYQKRCRTYTELGAGYDESDSFIDNSEAVEEGIDHTYIKKHDGFYVNCEKFVSASGSEQSDAETHPRRSKKNADSSSVSSEESSELNRVKKPRHSQEEAESVSETSLVSDESGGNKKTNNPVYDYDALMELEHKHLVRNGDGNDKEESSPEDDY